MNIHWFRNDLRLSDNPALRATSEHAPALLIYILDEDDAGEDTMGAATKWWLYHSLCALNVSLDHHLSVYRGHAMDIFKDLIQRYHIKAVHWNRCYEGWRVRRDAHIEKYLTAHNITVKTYNGSLLWEPWTVHKEDGQPYKVFTPFYQKGCLGGVPPRKPLPIPENVRWIHDHKKSLTIPQLELLPTHSWGKKLEAHWRVGEYGAQAQLQDFIDKGLKSYKDGRNFPAKPCVSKLSPYLHFGEISPHQAWRAVRTATHDDHVEHFCSELGWREFSYSQLYNTPDLPRRNLRPQFDRFPWREAPEQLKAWQKGQTGVPMVDAGMRELWQTGYMHNRVRMIVASFLVKNLRIHWRHGAQWFWDTLVDADLANNSASWQWVAGCGADAAPYFRIFNPVTQGQKFDPAGEYIRRFVPEIGSLSNAHLFAPWQAPVQSLEAAQIRLGVTYPEPMVDLKASRQEALAAFRSLK